MVRATLVLLLLLWSSIAHAEKRVALVIGNGAYANVPKLNNPTNDASVMETMFRVAGFDTVVRANDLSVTAMRRALRDFSDTAHDADIAVVFYAGHGIEVSGTNYLIPIDAVLEQDIDARDEAVRLDRVNEILEPAKRLRLVILDACRDNPFVRSMRRTLATRTVRTGYGEIDERSLPPNTLVAYAQRAGATADDGQGANSPYTTALLKHLPTPGLDIELALRRVRDDVLKATRNKQEPFKYGSLGGAEIALVPTKEPQQAATLPTLAVDYDKEMEVTFWHAVKDSKSKDLLQTYLDRYPSGNFAGLAKVLTDQLGREPPTANPAAERHSDPAKVAALPKLEQPSAGGSFDGTWYLHRLGPGCTGAQDVGQIIRIANGAVSGRAKLGPITGTASSTGQLRYSHASHIGDRKTPDGYRITYQVTLRGNSGSGTFRHTGPGTRCQGTITATRG
jgi:hypothetical protein